MPKNFVLLLLGAVLLLQCCEHAAAKSIQKSDSSEEDDLSSRDRLLVFTLTEFAILGKFTIAKGKDVLNKVTKDADVLKSNSELLNRHLHNFTEYIERVEKFEQAATKNDKDRVVTLFTLFVDFTEMTEKYNTAEQKEPTAEDRLIEESLKKNGLEKLEEELAERFLEFARDLDETLTKYVNSLSEKERADESKIIEWQKEFNNEKDFEQKIETFPKFFELFK